MTKRHDKDGEPRCSFCGRTRDEVKKLIAGPSVYICNECVELCNDIIAEEYEREAIASSQVDLSTILEKLEPYAIPHETPKQKLTAAFALHYSPLLHKDGRNKLLRKRDGILLVGNNGVGKKYLVRKLAEVFDTPCVTVSALHFSSHNQLKDVSFIEKLAMSPYPDDKISEAVIYVDHFDKIATTDFNDVYLKEAQLLLSSIIQGTIFNVTPEIKKSRSKTIDTSNMLLIFGGSFVTRNELNSGMAASRSKPLRIQSQPDLISYGIIQELASRLPLIINFKDIDEQHLKDILTSSRDTPLNRFKQIFKVHGVDLDFDEEAIQIMAHEAYRRQTGIPGVFAIIEDLSLDLCIECFSKSSSGRMVVSKGMISERLQVPNQ